MAAGKAARGHRTRHVRAEVTDRSGAVITNAATPVAA